jgi:hypothetical protein
MKEKKLEKRIKQIKEALQITGDMRPGSLNKQFTVCGKENCRCIDPKDPQKHGPYFQLSYVHQGKSTTQFIRKESVDMVSQQLENYKTFRELTNEWVDLALKLAKENLQAEKERIKAEKVSHLTAKRNGSRSGSKSRETKQT